MTEDAATKAETLLKANHDKFHVFWNLKGYHNHQVHYLLTAYALGASPEQLQSAFDTNLNYQRPRQPIDETLVKKFNDERYFKSLMGNDAYFNDYTAFFQRKFEEEGGYPSVVNKYLFSRAELADDLLVGLHAGENHSLPFSRSILNGILTLRYRPHRRHPPSYPLRVRNRVPAIASDCRSLGPSRLSQQVLWAFPSGI